MAQPADALNILLVDDDAANRGLFLLMLRELKIGDRAIVAATAQDGVDALQKWQRGVDHRHPAASFDLIFMDCCMPEMDGYEATQRIREQEGINKRVTIVGLTALIMSKDRNRCLEVGMDDHLCKPVTMEDLSATVSKWLHQILQQRQIKT